MTVEFGLQKQLWQEVKSECLCRRLQTQGQIVCFFLKLIFFLQGEKLCKVAPLGPVNEKQQCEIFAPSILFAEAAYYIFSFESWRFLRSLPSS